MHFMACMSTALNIMRTPCGAGHPKRPLVPGTAHNVTAKAAEPHRQRHRSPSV